MKTTLVVVVLASAFGCIPASVQAQGLHAKIAARKAEAEKPKGVKDAVEITMPRSYADSYDDVLNWIKKSNDFTADFTNSNKDNGIVASTIVEMKDEAKGVIIKRKTGRRLVVELIKEGGAETTLKVAVVNITRLGGDAWSTKPQDTTLNVEETQAVVERLKANFLPK